MSNKTARMGFHVVTSGEGELNVSSPADLAKRKADKKYESWLRSKESKRRCWHKHKDAYMARKRQSRATVEGRYKTAERTAIRRGQGWEFTLDEWVQKWHEAGWVRVPGSDDKQKAVPAYFLRGRSELQNTSMHRIDTKKPWRADNTVIMFRGKPLLEQPSWSRSPQA